MICLPNLMFWSGDDLNVEVQTRGLLRLHAKDHHAPRQARVFAGHGLLAAEHLCALSIGISNHLFPHARLYGRPDSPTSGQSCGVF